MKQLCDDKPLLIAYLYGECDDADRRLVEEHLAGCARCASEVAELRDVRTTLRQWSPPEQALGFRIVRDGQAEPAREASPDRVLGWRRAASVRVPAWAQAMAAVLVLAVAAGIANLDVRIGNGGVTIHTGWQKAPAVQVQARPAQSAPWRTDLAALERRLREDLAPAVAARPASVDERAPAARVSPEDTAAILRRVQGLIADSEQRQQREMDQQMAQGLLRMSRDVTQQRIYDLHNIQQGLSQMDVRTNELRQTQNYLLRIANVQQIK